MGRKGRRGEDERGGDASGLGSFCLMTSTTACFEVDCEMNVGKRGESRDAEQLLL